jgi:hypothetical protein
MVAATRSGLRSRAARSRHEAIGVETLERMTTPDAKEIRGPNGPLLIALERMVGLVRWREIKGKRRGGLIEWTLIPYSCSKK